MEKREISAESGHRQRPRIHLLVVARRTDDLGALRSCLERGLPGCRVTELPDPAGAVELLNLGAGDAVVVALGDERDLGFLRQLRRESWKVRRIALARMDASGLADQALRDGAEALLWVEELKPEVVRHRLASMFDGCRNPATAPEMDDSERTDFIANVSHEIRTPMNAIVGMSNLIQQTDLSAAQRDYVDAIREAADAVTTLLADVLDYSRVRRGRLYLEKIEFSLRDAVDQVRTRYLPLAEAKGLPIHVDLYGEPPDLLVGDPSRLKLILGHLLGNAIKFTEDGEVRLSVSVDAIEPDRVRLHFAVRDTGIGIPPDMHEAIFDSFSQVDGSVTRAQGGTGIGLSIARQLVQRMGGRLQLESQAGRGSVFRFTVPMMPAALPEDRARRVPYARLKGARVLVVDGDATSRRIAKRSLRAAGMRVDEVDRAECALAQAREAAQQGDAFELAVVDDRLADRDGFAVSERLARESDGARMSVILLARSGQRGDAARCREAGVAGYLTKPICPGDLLDAVRAVVGMRGRVYRELVTRHFLREARRSSSVVVVATEGSVAPELVQGLADLGHVVRQLKLEALEAAEGIGSQDVVVVRDHARASEVARRRLARRLGGKDAPGVVLIAGEEAQKTLGAIARVRMQAEQVNHLALAEAIEQVLEGEEESLVDPPVQKVGAVKQERLLERSGGDTRLMCELAAMFIDESAGRIESIADALERHDLQDLRHRAHKIKGALGMLAAESAYEAALSLEEAARRSEVEELDRAFINLKGQIDLVVQDLEVILGENRAHR